MIDAHLLPLYPVSIMTTPSALFSLNNHPYFGFPTHVQQALLELYSKISSTQRLLGEAFFYKRQLSVRSWNPERYSFVYHVDYGDTALTWNSTDKSWKSTCDCRQKTNCCHVAAVIYALIGRSKIDDLVVQQQVVKENSVQERAKKQLGRNLTKAERIFLDETVTLWEGAANLNHYSISELLNPSYTHIPQFNSLILPPPNSTFDEFWSVLAFQVRKIKSLTIPEFMKVFENESTAQKSIAEIVRKKEVENWKKLISRSTQENPKSNASVEIYDLRLILTEDNYQFAVKSEKQTEFKTLSKGALKRFFQELSSGIAHVIPDATGVFYFLKDFLNKYDSFLTARAQAGLIAQSFAHLAMNPASRQRIVKADGQTYEWPEQPVHWKLKEVTSSSMDAEYVLALPNGNPLLALSMIIPCSPPLYITNNAIYRGPPPFPSMDSYTSMVDEPPFLSHTQIPVDALLSPEGIHFLTVQQLPPPPAIAKRMQSSPLHLHILVKRKNKIYRDELFFTFSAVHGNGKKCAEFQEHFWTPVNDNGRAISPNSGPILIPDYSTLPNMLNLVHGPLKLKSSFENGKAWFIRSTASFHKQFVQWIDQLPPGVDLTLPDDLNAFREPAIQASFRLECTPAENLDWFDLKVVVQTQNVELTPDELKALMAARGKFVELPGKGWRRMAYNVSQEDNEKLARLGLQAEDLSDETHRLHALQLADPAAEDLLSQEQVAEIRKRAALVKTQVTPPVPPVIQAQLRPYQVEGFHFLSYLAENAFGGILADDMGLGKTLQTLAWLAWLREKTPNKPSLVICPKSVADNWHHEALQFYPTLKVTIWRGSNDDEFLMATQSCDLVVINYSQLRSLSDATPKVSWLAAILDEGQYIKNPQSQTASTARKLEATHRLVLTGTPIENRLLDLWSLMSYSMPGLLGPQARFTRQYDHAGDPLARQRLSARVRPFLLRRTKSQVAPELPPRTEEDLLCEMTPRQETLYRAELKAAQMRLLNISTKKEFDSERFNFLTSLLRLRQICCHPNLFAEENSAEAQEPGAKEEALLDLLEPLMEEGHKVLVFSQFVSVIERLELLLAEHEWKSFVLTGETEERGKLVEDFQTTEGAAIFLISLKAGGFGLNLTAASYVVLFDPWWNPAVENQAIDRTHRIGQTRPVIAYRLIARNSIEEKIRLLQKSKSAIASAVLGEEQFAKALTLDDLRFLLENS